MKEPRTVTLDVEGRTFDFQLHQRHLNFGQAGTGEYYWMDSRQFRSGKGGPNFQACVDLWWHVVEWYGDTSDPHTEMALVFAECYPLINASRAMQNIYVDAHLHPKAERILLADEDVKRLLLIAHSGDPNLARLELDRLFRGPYPPPGEMPAFDEAAEKWIRDGISALQLEGRNGLKHYTKTLLGLIKKYRRRGNSDWKRMFLNKFSYECKVAFYYCYANAWIGILPRLQQRGELDSLGERFMRLWHHQNQAPEGATEHRGVFSGQIPALHPISAVILTSPQHLEVIGRYIGRPDFSELQASGMYLENKEYRDMVTTILVAAHEYDRSRRSWEDQRGQSTQKSKKDVKERPRDDGTASVQILFENYTNRRRVSCSDCSGTLSYVRHEPVATTDPPAVVAYFRCQACAHEQSLKISQDELVLTQRF